jgi:transmembrane secretion effector
MAAESIDFKKSQFRFRDTSPAVLILPWARAHFSPNTLTRLAALLSSIVYVLMALIREAPAFLLVAALVGVIWTVSASELWVAAQRAMSGWARGRMNATVIMVSQGAMALGGILWGTIAATAGVNSDLMLRVWHGLYPDIGISLLKQPFATFIESITAAAVLQPDKQTLHGLGPIDYRLEFSQFVLRQFLPASRCPGTTFKTKKQFSDFI